MRSSPFLFILLAIAVFCTSCSIADRLGFEKRRYRPGYYLDGRGGSHEGTTLNTSDEQAPVSSGSTTAVTEDKKPAEDPLIRQTPAHENSRTLPLAVTKPETRDTRPVLHKLCSKPIHTVSLLRKAMHPRAPQGCGDIIVEITVILIAAILIAIFPALDPGLAQFFAALILLAILGIGALVVKAYS